VLARINCSVVSGVDACFVEVEVDISYGLPAFNIVGLPEIAVRESRERVKAAVKNSGYTFPPDRITVNLAPADIRKEGTGFDLPVAMGILAASKVVSADLCSRYSMVGELSLDGRVKSVPGVVAAALSAKEKGLQGILVPRANGQEASVVQGVEVLPVESLSQAVNFFSGFENIVPLTCDLNVILDEIHGPGEVDFCHVMGQSHVKRALEIAATGGHNLMMTGSPGSGKSMMAKRLPSILPGLTYEEAMETTRIYSAAGLLRESMPFVTTRPFRSPHHTVSAAGLVGGGLRPQPGEVTLAHNGLLFLDELPEFRRNVLEVLRQPMEDGRVTISRAGNQLSYPAEFMLVAAMNPCPCGYSGDSHRECSCTHAQIQRYRSRISGPLLDRIDLHIDVPAVPFRELSQNVVPESSAVIRERVEAARQIQLHRFSGKKNFCNAAMGSRQIKSCCTLGDKASRLLETAITHLGFSARAYSRILKIARTIADLEPSRSIGEQHVAEAIQYRTLDRKNGFL